MAVGIRRSPRVTGSRHDERGALRRRRHAHRRDGGATPHLGRMGRLLRARPGEGVRGGAADRPVDTAAEVLPRHDPARRRRSFDELEDADAAHGEVLAIDGAATLLAALRGRPMGARHVERRTPRRAAFRGSGSRCPQSSSTTTATGAANLRPTHTSRGAELLGVDAPRLPRDRGLAVGRRAGVAAGMTVWS